VATAYRCYNWQAPVTEYGEIGLNTDKLLAGVAAKVMQAFGAREQIVARDDFSSALDFANVTIDTLSRVHEYSRMGLNQDRLAAGTPSRIAQEFNCWEQIVEPGLTVAYTWSEDTPGIPPSRGKDFWPAFRHLVFDPE
jgi:hypothetical protein